MLGQDAVTEADRSRGEDATSELPLLTPATAEKTPCNYYYYLCVEGGGGEERIRLPHDNQPPTPNP